MGECRRLGEQTKADRRLREQHGKMLASVKGLKQQVEAEIAGRARLEADLASLQAKVGGKWLDADVHMNIDSLEGKTSPGRPSTLLAVERKDPDDPIVWTSRRLCGQKFSGIGFCEGRRQHLGSSQLECWADGRCR